MVRFYEAAPVEKIWKKHALVRFVVDMERALTKAVEGIDAEQKRTARGQLAKLEPTDFRSLVVSALDERLAGAGNVATPSDAGRQAGRKKNTTAAAVEPLFLAGVGPR